MFQCMRHWCAWTGTTQHRCPGYPQLRRIHGTYCIYVPVPTKHFNLKYFLLIIPVFRIRINFIRIRIQPKIWIRPGYCSGSSVVSPNTLNMDPDPGLYVLYNQFLKKKILNNFREKSFSIKHVHFLNYKNKLSPKKTFRQLSLWIVN